MGSLLLHEMEKIFFLIISCFLIICQTLANGQNHAEEIVGKAVKIASDDFIAEEKIKEKSGNLIGYFVMHTPASKKLARDSDLVHKVMEEVEKIEKKGSGGSDYQNIENDNMTRAETLKMVFEFLDKLDKKKSGDYQDDDAAADNTTIKVNPLTGSCVREKVGISSGGTQSHTDLSGNSCRRRGFTLCSKSDRYRKYDGSCNNLVKTSWGATSRKFRRILKAEYPDGKGKFKTKAIHRDKRNGRKLTVELPLARALSNRLHQLKAGDKKPGVSNRTSHMLMQFGQFVDHDIVLTPEPEKRCCRMEVRNSGDCKNIRIKPGDSKTDKIYNNKEARKKGEPKQNCIPFSRSSVVCPSEENPGREQFNALTIFLDMSAIYGSEDDIAIPLRTKERDLKRNFLGWKNLGTLIGNRQRWNLPSRKNVHLRGHTNAAFPNTKVSGDLRCDEQPGLLMMHTVFFMEHNRIAKALQTSRVIMEYLETLNTTKEKDDFIYGETRRLLAGIFQSIVYREYLPQVLGPKLMTEYGLITEPGTQSEYDPNIDPTAWNEFATFAYRFGHTLISSDWKTTQGFAKKEKHESFILKDVFFNATHAENKNRKTWWLPVLRGLMVQPAEAADRYLNDIITNELFMSAEKIVTKEQNTTGKHMVELGDLAARNIQRGRDHGLSDYNSYRIWAGLRDITEYGVVPCYECCYCRIRSNTGNGNGKWKKCTKKNEGQGLWKCTGKIAKSNSCKLCFKKRENEVRKNRRLRRALKMKIDDFIDLGKTYFWFLDIIDPFTGALFETPLPGGEVGPTNAKIIADQFERLKYGDRFFFNHKETSNARGLGSVARKNVMRRTLASIFCENAPLTKKHMLNSLKLPQNPFRLDSTILKCEDILKESRLDMVEISKEIVRSLGKGSDAKKNECDVDEDCENTFANQDGNIGSYIVCSSQECQIVTGECNDAEDCSGGTCENNFCVFHKGEQSKFRKKCQAHNNCNTTDCNL